MLKKYTSRILTFIFLAAFIVYALNNPQLFNAFDDVSLIPLLFVLLGKTFYHFANGLFTKWTTEAFTDHTLTIGEGYYIGILTAIGNFFGPLLGGTGIRAVYLKKNHGLSYSKFTSTLFGYYIMLFFSTFLWGGISVLLLPKSAQTSFLLVFFVLACGGLVGLAVTKLPRRELFGKLNNMKLLGKLIETVYEIQSGWRLILSKRILLLKLFILANISYIATVFISLVEFHIFGIEISLPALGLYSVLMTSAVLISFTPGAIGIREALVIAVGTTLSVTNEQILQVAVLDRASVFFLLFILFVLTRSQTVKKFFTKKEIRI